MNDHVLRRVVREHARRFPPPILLTPFTWAMMFTSIIAVWLVARGQCRPDCWRDATRETDSERLDEELDQSFPASDPPSFTSGIARVQSTQ